MTSDWVIDNAVKPVVNKWVVNGDVSKAIFSFINRIKWELLCISFTR
jgi:hypothetical protein